jgi:hypothetical protein
MPGLDAHGTNTSGYLAHALGLRPKINDNKNNTINTKNKILAIPTAVPAIPPNPNAAAIRAIRRNVTDQLNMGESVRVLDL